MSLFQRKANPAGRHGIKQGLSRVKEFRQTGVFHAVYRELTDPLIVGILALGKSVDLLVRQDPVVRRTLHCAKQPTIKKPLIHANLTANQTERVPEKLFVTLGHQLIVGLVHVRSVTSLHLRSCALRSTLGWVDVDVGNRRPAKYTPTNLDDRNHGYRKWIPTQKSSTSVAVGPLMFMHCVMMTTASLTQHSYSEASRFARDVFADGLSFVFPLQDERTRLAEVHQGRIPSHATEGY
jgi:hypothetical protein